MANNESTGTVDSVGKGLGIASLVTSLLGMGLIGFILGLVGLSKSKKAGQKNGLALAGTIIGAVVMAISVVIFIVVISIIAMGARSFDDSKNVSNQFLNAVQAGEPGAAYDLTSSSFRQVTDEEQLSGVIAQVTEALQGNEEVTASAINSNNGVTTATFVYTISTVDGPVYVRIVLQQNGSEWEVVSFKSSDSVLTVED